jgi:predicted amidohydrolase YtcJ
MVVDNSEIIRVGPNAKAKVLAGSKTVELRGKFVMPGLIDLHFHLDTVRDLTQTPTLYNLESVKADLRQYAAYGVTTVQSMGTDTDAIFEITKERSGRPTYSRVYAAG